MSNKFSIFTAVKDLKDLEISHASLVTKLTDTEKALTEAQDNIGTLMTEAKAFEAKLTTKDTEHKAALEAKATEHKAAVEKLTADFSAKLTALEAQVKQESLSADAKAAQKLASIGVTLDELPKNSANEQSRKTKGYTVISHIGK